MSESPFASQLEPALAEALEKRGFTALTAVQAAVLEPGLEGRDLRISSQTGSGKTVAIGLSLRDVVREPAPVSGGVARPRAIVVEPTRELAKQVEDELTWLFAPLGIGVVSVTGGASYRDEQRALSRGPGIVVGTPGRLLDHLERGTLVGEACGVVVLDEADRLLDMGFRDDLEAILAHAPEDHRTHLVSATFAPEVRALADRVQTDPVRVEGTRLGAANADIEHVVHLLESRQRVDALVNLLLADPEAQTLVFARTRAEVASIAQELEEAGFAVRSLSGDMEQRARNRALDAFKRGELHVLVATDVAARGIDVQDIRRVIHVEPPTDADTYTHRSGRTGRAGRKGASVLLVPMPALPRTQRLLREAGVTFRFAPVPSAEEIRAARAARVFDELTGDDPEGFSGFDPSLWALATKLAEAPNVPRTLARLLLASKLGGVTAPRAVRVIEPPSARPRAARDGDGAAGAGPRAKAGVGGWVPFRVTWGRERGADARRLLALVCRRGNVRGQDIGAIRIDFNHAIVEVAASVAEEFEASASQPDARDPRLQIRREVARPRDRERDGSRGAPREDVRDTRTLRPRPAHELAAAAPAKASRPKPGLRAAKPAGRPSKPSRSR